jgi:hypothetical protein
VSRQIQTPAARLIELVSLGRVDSVWTMGPARALLRKGTRSLILHHITHAAADAILGGQRLPDLETP